MGRGDLRGFSRFALLHLLRFRPLGQSVVEGLCRGSPVHAPALLGSAVVVGLQEGVEIGLHFVERLVELLAAHDAEVLVQERPVEPLDKAVRLRPPDPRGAVLDALQLEEQLVGMAILAATELAPVVGERRGDGGAMVLEDRQHVVVHDVHRGDRQLGGIEPVPGVAAVAVDDALQIDLADALQVADEEGVHGHQVETSNNRGI